MTKSKILITGGTIDKRYQMHSGEMSFEESCIHEILDVGRNRVAYDIETLMLKDSLNMDDSDRKEILDACTSCAAKRILITHGTDTMTKTASYLAQNAPDLAKEKTTIFVGAMIPYKVDSSDASFNIGFAMGVLAVKKPGLYIAMNGKLSSYNNVQKDKDSCEFI